MNNELEVIRKDVIAVCFEVVSRRVWLERQRKTTKNLIEDSWSADRDLSPRPVEHGARVINIF